MNDSSPLHCDILYLSPHLDDAALSCGGRIFDQARAGKEICILTIFTAPPTDKLSELARDLHRRWGLDAASVMAERRQEDEAACHILGARWVHWPFLDALYRQTPLGLACYPTLKSLFSTPDPADTTLVDKLAMRLRQEVQADIVHAPLAVGRHVDHQLTRRTAEQAFGATSLHFYEDYPYARQQRALTQTLRPRRDWRSSAWPLGTNTLDTKIRAIACFASQLGTVFQDRADLERQVKSFTRRRGGERSWRRR